MKKRPSILTVALLITACSDTTVPEPSTVVGDPDTSAPDTGIPDTGTPLDCTHYAGVGGSLSAAGTRGDPLPELETLAADGLPDGVLCLLDGDHGSPVLHADGHHIRALNPGQARVSTLQLTESHALTIEGLLVQPVLDTSEDQRDHFLILADADSTEITLLGLHVRSADSREGWSSEDWTWHTWSGVDLRGPDARVEDCTIENVHHALSVRGDGAEVHRNTITGFGGDGIRGLGSSSRYSWNLVQEAFVDDYENQHDDAFQAYDLSDDPRIADVHIHHNRFILSTDPGETTATLMQGILLSDGYADGWVVEDNLVVNAQYHGISIYGARNCRVQNNTVVAHPSFSGSTPWIRLSPQTKTGQENRDNIIRNNIASMLTPWDYADTSLVEANLELESDAHFVDAAALDFHLDAASSAVEGGVNEDLSETDLDGAPRQVGVVDLGAFERQ